MAENLPGKRVDTLVANGFAQVELSDPNRVLEEAGATVLIVSPEPGKVKGWQHTDWGDEFDLNEPLDQAKAEEFDALVLPGGVMNPDRLRRNEWALQFVRAFRETGKPIGAICHGPWTLIDAGVVPGRKMTSYESIPGRPAQRRRDTGR